eukprot:15327592-Ditylum_brightwellii.AAC.1
MHQKKIGGGSIYGDSTLTHYDVLREYVLATRLDAVVVVHMPDEESPHGPALQCALNKWKMLVELAKLGILQ